MARRAVLKSAPKAPVAADDAALQTLQRELAELRADVLVLQGRLARAEELADADVLTPVLNRRAFVRELNRTLATAARYGAKACLLYFDLDGFKGVNDRFGHEAGDKALTFVAECLLANTRRSDVVGRMGGDEFAVILAHTNETAARAKAARLTAAIQAEAVRIDAHSFVVQASCGVRMIDATATAEKLLAQADAAMFLSKPERPPEY